MFTILLLMYTFTSIGILSATMYSLYKTAMRVS